MKNTFAGRSRSSLLAGAALFLLASLLSFGGQSNSPGADRAKGQCGFLLTGCFPVGSFFENVGRPGYGLSMYLGRRFGNSGFTIGVDLSFLLYGHRTRIEHVSGDLPVEVDVSTNNNIVQGYIILKQELGRSRVRPFVEALAGINYLYTDTMVSGRYEPYDEIASVINLDDYSFSAGGGAGLGIRLDREVDYERGQPRRIQTFLEIKMRYLAGGRARYLTKDSFAFQDGGSAYLFNESRTDLLSLQVGISMTF